jgi:hypothetical protein
MHVKSSEPDVLIEQTCCRKGILRFIRNTLVMHSSFIRIAQKVNSAELINNKNILKRMPFLLAAVIQFSVNFITRTMNGTFYAVMDKR